MQDEHPSHSTGREPSEYCERCQRPAPAIGDRSYLAWEAIERNDGVIGVICPGCVTREEQQAIDEEVLAQAARRAQCVRCGRQRPGFGRYPEPPGVDPESHGWYVVDDGIVCAACATVEEMQGGNP